MTKKLLCEEEVSGWNPGGAAYCNAEAAGEVGGRTLCQRHLKAATKTGKPFGSVPTFTATIYVGFRSVRTDAPTFTLHTIDEARAICQAYCNAVGLCVTLTPTEFVYTDGGEPGVIVGLINYPRFSSTPEAIRKHALTLAERLRVGLGQWRVSVVMPGETVMLGEGPKEDPK
jgi:ferredoxin